MGIFTEPRLSGWHLRGRWGSKSAGRDVVHVALFKTLRYEGGRGRGARSRRKGMSKFVEWLAGRWPELAYVYRITR